MREKIKSLLKTKWIKNIGLIGFLFFLIKGLVWLGLAVWAWMKLSD